MDFIISLATFCEVHGPTSILSTQVQPISCTTCFPESSSHSSALVGGLVEDAQRLALQDEQQKYQDELSKAISAPTSRTPSFSRRSQDYSQNPQKNALLNQHIQQSSQLQSTQREVSESALQTPPLSPASSRPQYLGSFDAAERHHIKELRSDTCNSCSLSLPQNVTKLIPNGAPGSPTKDGRGRHGSPILRTKEAFVAGNWPVMDGSFHSSDDSSDDELEEKIPGAFQLRHDSKISPLSSSPESTYKRSAYTAPTSYSSSSHSPRTEFSSNPSMSSSMSSVPSIHTHTVTYLSTRNPPNPTAFSLLRRASLSALSNEHLPQTGSGPLLKGDSVSGYTISYIFRLTDSRARGKRRCYALICWAGRSERRAITLYSSVISFFKGVVKWISDSVEKESNATSYSVPASPVKSGYSGASRDLAREITPASSFLVHNVDSITPPNTNSPFATSGYASGAAGVRAKGLAELTGNEGFFVELHGMFVMLLRRLGLGVGDIGVPVSALQSEGSENGSERGKQATIERHESRSSTNLENTPTAVAGVATPTPA